MSNKKNKRGNCIDVVAYTENDRRKDEETFNKSMETYNVDFSAFRRLMVSDLCTNSDIIETGYIGNIRIEEAREALKWPKKNWRKLLDISEQLMMVSPHYYRLNNMYSNMAVFLWGVGTYGLKEGYNPTALRRKYAALVSRLEDMNIKHEFSKVMKSLPYQDIYCGLVAENDSDFFIQKINHRICKLQQVQDGLYNFKINLAAINLKELNAYPDYVQDAYLDFVEGRSPHSWYMPPAEKQICIKLNSQWTTPYPFMVGLVRDILDLDVYQKLSLQSARTDNYKAILIQVPIDTSAVDKPLITPETLGVFADINRENMSDDIGMIHTLGSKGEAISFKDSANSRNNVSDAVEELYNAAGVSQEMFNASNTATALTLAVENDGGFMYGVYRQFERWVNRYIKLNRFNAAKFKFNFYLIDATIFNRDSVMKRYKEACTLGVPVVDRYLAMLDMTPSETLGAYVTHNDIFDYYSRFKPLSTSYTSGDSTTSGGRPTNESKGESLSDEGEKSADLDKNKM